jgi:hypothetical protein
MKKFISRHPSTGVLPGCAGNRMFSSHSDLAWVVIPGDPPKGMQARAHDQAGREVRGLRLNKEARGRRFTAGRASTLRNVKCQSLYFGPPW